MTIPLPLPGCPWSEISSWAVPNIKWCEAQSCGWIVEPINTWSNVAYILLAFLIWKKLKSGGHPLLKHFVWISVFVGFSSFIYHASYTFIFQFFDFLSMFTLVSLMLAFNLRRSKMLKETKIMPFFFSSLVVNSFLVFLFYRIGIPIQLIVVVLVLMTLGTEWIARKRTVVIPKNSSLIKSIVSIIGACFFTIIDGSRLVCDPNSLFQGHSIWHLLSAVTIYFMFEYYRQFDFSED